MRTVKSAEHLEALPLRVVLRTAVGHICERTPVGTWLQTGEADPVALTDDDFPAKVLWTAADDIAPDPEEAEALRQLLGALSGQQSPALSGEVVPSTQGPQ